MQRLRIKFSRGDELKFISHLDIMRLWERAFIRAGLNLAYSEGFSPRPHISLAAPLAVGVTSEAELMDVFLNSTVSPHWFTGTVSRQLPRGVDILAVFQMAQTMPSLQSRLRFAEYEVKLEKKGGPEDVEKAISDLLDLNTLPWHHHRDTGRRDYDLRLLIEDIWLVGEEDDCYNTGMRLRCDNAGSGRPEQVALALGFETHPRAVHRTRLILEA